MSEGLREKYVTLHEIVAAARRNPAPGPWRYLIGGAGPAAALDPGQSQPSRRRDTAI